MGDTLTDAIAGVERGEEWEDGHGWILALRDGRWYGVAPFTIAPPATGWRRRERRSPPMASRWRTRGLPPDGELVLASYVSDYEGAPGFGVTMAFRRDERWLDGTPGDWDGDELSVRVLAWQPWPEPYQPKEPADAPAPTGPDAEREGVRS